MDFEGLPRVVTMVGASNVRDLGGWPTRDGGRVRFGQVYRSAALHGLTDADMATLTALDIRTICDFRGEGERTKWPSRLPANIAVHELTIAPTIGASLRDLIANRDATRANVVEVMQEAYAAYATSWHHQYRRMFDLVLDCDGALLFHCTAGKDRTGFGAALLLSAIGVEDDAIWEDYLATNRLWSGDSELAATLPLEVGATLLSVDRAFLAAAFAAIAAEHASIAAYLETHLGLDDTRRSALRALLVE
jgi:protein-tyrosine phosphatase